MDNLHPDAKIIERLGGPAKLAARLGYTGAKATARVFNWTKRGIPARVRLDNLELFGQPKQTRRRRVRA